MIVVKKHKTPDQRLILALCDKELLGKNFQDKNICLDLSSDFYNGKIEGQEKLKELITQSYIVNAVGKHSVELCVLCGIVEKEHVINVNGIKHAQSVRFSN